MWMTVLLISAGARLVEAPPDIEPIVLAVWGLLHDVDEPRLRSQEAILGLRWSGLRATPVQLLCHTGQAHTDREHRTAQTPQCIGALILPNVVPEGLENTGGCADVLMPWGVAWH